MSLEPELLRRLQADIQPGHYEEIRNGRTLVEETEPDSKARITCVLPEGAVGIRWKIENAKLFPFLKQNLAADGNLLIRRADGTYEAHLMECKKTVNQYQWGRAKQQLRWSLVRLRALAGVLGIQLRRIVCYTAFRVDSLTPESLKDVGAVRMPLGQVSPEDVQEAKLPPEYLDWLEPLIELEHFDDRFRHEKVRLDPATGTTQIQLI